MKTVDAPAREPGQIREAIRQLVDSDLAQQITELAFSTKMEQSVLHYARNEKRRRNHEAKKASKAAR